MPNLIIVSPPITGATRARATGRIGIAPESFA